MAGLRPPKVTEKLVPVFSSGELTKLERACQGRTFAQRRDYAIICVFRAPPSNRKRRWSQPVSPAI